MSTNDASSGVSNCYVFKSRLQEYAQKNKLPTPVYETFKEGPSHEPAFRSTVTVNGVKYDSLSGFFNRKAAEQSAAEVALFELAKSNGLNECVSQPVHETGLCKNLLQEYAQKMNYAIPLYRVKKAESPAKTPLFICTVDIGGIKYIGAAVRTKKDAEISAARTALLAIKSLSGKDSGNSNLTVLPTRKRSNEQTTQAGEPKAKKTRLRKKSRKSNQPNDQINDNGRYLGTDSNQPKGVVMRNETLASEGDLGPRGTTAQCQQDQSVGSGSIGGNTETHGMEPSSCLTGFSHSVGSIEAGAS